MKIEVDIPESIYDTIQADQMISREQLAVLQMHILNGTPLPTDAVDRVTIKEYLGSFGTAYELGKEKGLDIALDILDKYMAEGSEKIIPNLPSVTAQPCEDCISREAVMHILDEVGGDFDSPREAVVPIDYIADMVSELPYVTPMPKMGSGSENPNKWIPLKTRPMTDEESTFYRDWAEYGAELFDCPLPDDGQEVLISVYGGVEVDTFVKDGNDGCYFEGRDIDDVDAWMPLPTPPKKSEITTEEERSEE